MSKIGRETIGSYNSEMLIIDTKHSVDVCHVMIAAGQGMLKKGTVLATNDDGKCYILGTTECTASYILAEDADDASSKDVIAPAYRSGDFNRGALIVKENYTMTDADVTALRYGGIYLGNVM